jgi:hypothetical protein
MGTTRALAELRTLEAVQRLHELIADKDWRVRSSAIEAAVGIRRKDTLPVLLTRLLEERGRMRAEVAYGLRMLTGLDLGETPTRWQRWWDAEGASFELPTREEVLEIEALRADKKRQATTAASFYGLPVISDRVCFVVDVSGSMETPADAGDRTSSDKSGPTRISVALDQLRDLIRRIPEGDRCNMIFFDSNVRAWEKQVVPLNDRTRADALEFINRRKAAGATNLYDALALAFDDPLVDTIYVLSDGMPNQGRITVPAQIREDIRNKNRLRRIIIHGVSVGQASALLRGLADDSGGKYVEVGVPRRRGRTVPRSSSPLAQ